MDFDSYKQKQYDYIFAACEVDGKIDWDLVSAHKDVDRLFIRENLKKINWTILTQKYIFTEDELFEFVEYIDWKWGVHTQKIPNILLHRIADKINWFDYRWNHNPGRYVMELYKEYFDRDYQTSYANICSEKKLKKFIKKQGLKYEEHLIDKKTFDEYLEMYKQYKQNNL